MHNMNSITPLQFTYTNHKGETSQRNVRPLGIWFGATTWHKGDQWFIKAYDLDREAERDFSIKDIVGDSSFPPGKEQPQILIRPVAEWHL